MHCIQFGLQKKMQRAANVLVRAARAIGRALLRYRSSVIYYSAVAAVLIAIALAAEGYRSAHEKEAALNEGVQTAADVSAAADANIEAPEGLALRLPAGARVLRAFAQTPEMNTALGQWETHTGTDIQYENDAILALCAGEVESVAQDARYGLTVIVRTGIDRVYYMGAADVSVRAGDRVEIGECIARQMDRVRCEAHLGAHVHIEAVIDGECVDIAPFLQME